MSAARRDQVEHGSTGPHDVARSESNRVARTVGNAGSIEGHLARQSDAKREDDGCRAASLAGKTPYLRVAKRVLDVVAALVGLVMALPVLLVCAIAVRLESHGPVFFRQLRVGQNGKLFRIIKLRTMAGQPEHRGSRITAADDARITPVGKWLRRTKLDEIPQLWNVLCGDMSLVGPRPELPEFVSAYSDIQRRVLELKPGLTGPSSLAFLDEGKILANQPYREVYYREVLLPRKLELDLRYCETVSLFGDLGYVIVTLARLFGLSRSRK